MNQLCDECFFLAIINLQIISSEKIYEYISWDKVISMTSSEVFNSESIQFKIWKSKIYLRKKQNKQHLKVLFFFSFFCLLPSRNWFWSQISLPYCCLFRLWRDSSLKFPLGGLRSCFPLGCTRSYIGLPVVDFWALGCSSSLTTTGFLLWVICWPHLTYEFWLGEIMEKPVLMDVRFLRVKSRRENRFSIDGVLHRTMSKHIRYLKSSINPFGTWFKLH